MNALMALCRSVVLFALPQTTYTRILAHKYCIIRAAKYSGKRTPKKSCYFPPTLLLLLLFLPPFPPN